MSAPAANTVAWFEIGAPDVDAAKAFYGQLFGWSFAPDGTYPLITAPGATGRPVQPEAGQLSSRRWGYARPRIAVAVRAHDPGRRLPQT